MVTFKMVLLLVTGPEAAGLRLVWTLEKGVKMSVPLFNQIKGLSSLASSFPHHSTRCCCPKQLAFRDILLASEHGGYI